MRNSKAKKLRRKAEEMTVGKPDVQYEAAIHPKGRAPFRKLIPDCTRVVYQKLKRE